LTWLRKRFVVEFFVLCLTGLWGFFLQQLRVVNLKAIELQQRTKKGWLLKRGGKLGNKGWDRRFFVLENSVLQFADVLLSFFFFFFFFACLFAATLDISRTTKTTRPLAQSLCATWKR
jgi:hypothetical protein